jgi:hypothetical protein
MLSTYEGGCHCGRVRFRVSGDLGGTVYCNCSLCSMRGFLHLIVPLEQFQCVEGEAALSTYQFGTRVAKHTFCSVCGVHPFYVPRSDPDKIDVNVRCIDGIDIHSLSPKTFDGRNWDSAIGGASWR